MEEEKNDFASGGADWLFQSRFKAQKPAEKIFYLIYDNLNRIVSMSTKLNVEDSEHKVTTITREVFDKLNTHNLLNYIVDENVNPPAPINIAGEQSYRSLEIPEVIHWADNRLVLIQFVKSTRKLNVEVKSQLPAVKKVWIIPRGNYMIPLLELEIQNQGVFEYDIPTWQNSNECSCISNQDIEIFTAYREVEHETDL